jgi:hypothetical protein
VSARSARMRLRYLPRYRGTLYLRQAAEYAARKRIDPTPREELEMSRNTQELGPCAIPPCPDCGARPVTVKDGADHRNEVTHEESCPLQAALREMKTSELLYFVCHLQQDQFVRPITATDLALYTWLGIPVPPGTALAVTRDGMKAFVQVTDGCEGNELGRAQAQAQAGGSK